MRSNFNMPVIEICLDRGIEKVLKLRFNRTRSMSVPLTINFNKVNCSNVELQSDLRIQ